MLKAFQIENRYRLDIDGLRAVAVIGVVLFHIDSSWLPGGFIGVDIFFVISGFLITSKIFHDYRKGIFSFTEFYRRRIKRLLPVLSVVILSTLITGQFILVPSDFKRLALSAIAAQFSAANLYFTYFLDTNYFAADANLEPLLHLWSLGAEEQFYLFWPALLVLGLASLRFRWLFAAVAAVTIASFLLGEFLVRSHPMWAYYMLPTRVGQLTAGALAFFALQHIPEGRLNRRMSECLAVAGIALITGSLWALDDTSPFPGLNAVPVTVGASLLVFAGSPSSSLTGRLLALQPMTAIGRISYSLYLWHWPVLSFGRYVFGDLSLTMKLTALGFMLALSIASYCCIEKPFRRSESSFRTVAVKQFVLPSVIVVALGGLVTQSSGYGIYTFDEGYRKALAGIVEPKPASRAPNVCQRARLQASDFSKSSCKIGSGKVADTYLWGDSHAGHYVGFLSEISEELNFTFRNAVHSACPPILAHPEQFAPPSFARGCQASGEVVREHLHQFDKIIIAGSWDTYLKTGEGFGSELAHTLDKLVKAGKRVVLLGQIPRLSTFDQKCRQKTLKIPFINCDEQAQVSRVRIDATNEIIRAIALGSGVAYYDPNDHLCAGDTCSGYFQGQPIYFDRGHLTHEGSRTLGHYARTQKATLSAFEYLHNNQHQNKAELR